MSNKPYKSRYNAENITLRREGQMAEACTVARNNRMPVAKVVDLALEHGLPAAKAKIEALKPSPAPRGR